jgi:hypothetical protein
VFFVCSFFFSLSLFFSLTSRRENIIYTQHREKLITYLLDYDYQSVDDYQEDEEDDSADDGGDYGYCGDYSDC